MQIYNGSFLAQSQWAHIRHCLHWTHSSLSLYAMSHTRQHVSSSSSELLSCFFWTLTFFFPFPFFPKTCFCTLQRFFSSVLRFSSSRIFKIVSKKVNPKFWQKLDTFVTNWFTTESVNNTHPYYVKFIGFLLIKHVIQKDSHINTQYLSLGYVATDCCNVPQQEFFLLTVKNSYLV